MFGCSSSRDLEARVVNNALIVSFLTADPPRVWRADMTGLATATLELREGTPGKFRLVMKTGPGKEEDISVFTDRETATNALRVVTSAMLSGDAGGSSGGSYSMSSASSGGGFLKPALWTVGIVAVLWFIGGAMINAAHMGAAHKLPADVKAGTAVPADKIFGGK
jgi:hypothetical protein